MDMNIEASHIVEICTAPSSSPKKLTVPLLGLERFPTHQEIEGQDARNRRPVRPIDRQRMRPWLMELLDMGNVFGLRWTSRHLGIFQISWRHASRLGWNLETDGDVFERWARHTGIYKEGDPPEPKRWKANFRCALHSLTDVLELTNAVERRGRNACRTYQFLQNSNSSNPKTKAKKQKAAELKVHRNIIPLITYEIPPPPEPEPVDLVSSGSSDELLSESESEGSQKDKVIVQRLEAKSQDSGEDLVLHHDHDYSAGPLKMQKTIYLRQGIGSIILQKEIHAPPDDVDEVKSLLLSNLDQLASAAVGSEIIMTQKSPMAGLVDSQNRLENLDKISPTKAVFDLTFNENKDQAEYSLNSLLPRLRARLKETDKVVGSIRKRKGSNIEIDLSELESLEQKGKKKEKVEESPPSPPMTRHRSNSPKKTVKVVTKTKKTKKEIDESTSDSTEPLMSSCLLLLEAATRLDNAEKNGSTSSRSSSKSNRKGITQSVNSTADVKRRASGRNLKSEKHADQAKKEEVYPNSEGLFGERYEIVLHDGETTEISQDMIIEEEIYPEDAVQVIYQVEEEQPEMIETEIVENFMDSIQNHDILRTALENIGSELEVSTVESSYEISSPKEMAIMRRKRDPDKMTAQNVVELSGQTEMSSFPKGLFSGSEIITDNQQQLSIVRKRMKGSKAKVSPKDSNIYYVDIHSNGGSICVKQADTTEAEEKEMISSQMSLPSIRNAIGIQQTVIQRELPVLTTPLPQKQTPQSVSLSSFFQAHNNGGNNPHIFIAANQNTADHQIIMPVNSEGSATISVNSPIDQSHTRIDCNQAKQLAGQRNSFITVGPHGKTLLYRSEAAAKAPQRTTIIPLLNPVTSSSPASNVKISTLPIVSSVSKPSVNISAPVTFSTMKVSDQKGLSSNSVVPIKFVSKVTTHTTSTGSRPSQVTAIRSGGKAWILQPKNPTSESLVSKAPMIQAMSPSVAGVDKPIISAIYSLSKVTDKPTISISSANSSLSTSVVSQIPDGSHLNSRTSEEGRSVGEHVPAQVVVDSILQIQSAVPHLSADNCSIDTSDESQVTSISQTSANVQTENQIGVPLDSLSGTANSSEMVLVKTEIGDDGTVVSSYDVTDTVRTSEIGAISQVSSGSPLTLGTYEGPITIIREDMDMEGTLTVQNTEENISEVSVQSSTDFTSPPLVTVSQESVETGGSHYQVLENVTDPSSSVAVDVIVKTEENDQHIYLSSEQGMQNVHIVHLPETISSEGHTPAVNMSEIDTINSMSEIETMTVVVETAPTNVSSSEIVVDMNSNEEMVPQQHHHHCHDSMHMDPRTPLAIGEIPLFAASKGDSDYMGSPVSE